METKYDVSKVAAEVESEAAADGAATMELLPPQVAAEVAHRLDAKRAGQIMARMDAARAAQVMSRMAQPTAARVLSAMDPDDRVDCLCKMRPPLHEALVAQMEAAEADETRRLEQYPSDTAGGIMTTQVTALPRNLTVEQAVAELRRLHEQLHQMFYVYVVDEQRRLVGVLSMRNLILAPVDGTLEQIMIPRVRSVPVDMDQEEVARQMRESRFLALPVVDHEARLVGLITSDDVVDVIQEEATEDMQRMFGAGAEERLASPWQFSFVKRIGWLQVNLGTAFLAGAVVALFGATIGRFAVLAIYIPVVASMGGNAAAQAMSVAIRGISAGGLGRTDRKLLHHVLCREAIVGLLTGIVVGATTAVIAWLWQYQHGIALGIIVAAALVITQTLACVAGAAIPFVMRKLNFDPAQSATIFTTTVTDVSGLASLLGLATIFQGFLK
ncbi:MAG: magnesium transporter [Tepidisphaeraceae bacterium]|jgi:magnesium transporter